MIIDNLTLAGLAVSASFALMPLLMGREFIRVRECPTERSATRPTRRTTVSPGTGEQRDRIGDSCVDVT
jgi:hypothetical protein